MPREGSVRLPDGRTLAYAEYGDPNGKPLFFFHGFPNSRIGARLGHEAAARDGVRVIAFDRPGFGKSDFKRGRRIGDWARDVAGAADALGIERFAVLGVSGGGPYAAACAANIPHRLLGVAIVSGLGPLTENEAIRGFPLLTRLYLRLLRRLPWLTWPGIWLIGRGARRDPRGLLRRLIRRAPPADRAAFENPAVFDTVAEDFHESFRQGARAARWEFELYLRPWDFDLAAIAVEVGVWQGEADNVVPPSMARFYDKVLPKCTARFFPGEGHFMVAAKASEIQRSLFAI